MNGGEPLCGAHGLTNPPTRPLIACGMFAFPAVIGLLASIDVVPPQISGLLGFALMFGCGTLSLRIALSQPATTPPDDGSLRADG